MLAGMTWNSILKKVGRVLEALEWDQMVFKDTPVFISVHCHILGRKKATRSWKPLTGTESEYFLGFIVNLLLNLLEPMGLLPWTL
jgi:hypothetical protein